MTARRTTPPQSTGDPRIPDDQSGELLQRPPGTDRGGRGAHSQFEVPPTAEVQRPGGKMGRSISGLGGMRDAAGTYLSHGGDDYLRGGHGGAPLGDAGDLPVAGSRAESDQADAGSPTTSADEAT